MGGGMGGGECIGSGIAGREMSIEEMMHILQTGGAVVGQPSGRERDGAPAATGGMRGQRGKVVNGAVNGSLGGSQSKEREPSRYGVCGVRGRGSHSGRGGDVGGHCVACCSPACVLLYSGGSNNAFLSFPPALLSFLLLYPPLTLFDPSFHLSSSSSSGLLLGADSARELSNPPPQANPPIQMMFPAPGGLAFNPGGSGARRFARGRGVNEEGRGGGGLMGGFRAGGAVAGVSANGVSAASMAHSGMRGTIPGYGRPGGRAGGGEWRGPFLAANFAAGLAAGFGGFGAKGVGRWAPVADQKPTHGYVCNVRFVVCTMFLNRNE